MPTNRPLLALAAFLGLGAAASGPAGEIWPAVVAALTAVLLALAWCAPLRAAVAALAAAGVGLGAVGGMTEHLAYDRAPLRALARDREGTGAIELAGVARRDAVPEDARFVLVLDVERATVGGAEVAAHGRVRVEVNGEAARPRVADGDRVSVWADLRRPRSAGSPGAFDPEAHAFRTGVHALGYAKTPRLVTVHGPADVGWIRRAAATARWWARDRIREVVPPGPEQALVRAMVLGDRAGLDDDTAEAFRIAGTYHVLALSGAQVALIAAILLAAVRRFLSGPAAVALLVAAPLVFYAQLVGADVPIVRATVMAVVLLAGRALAVDTDAANLLGLAAVALEIHRPSSIGDVGFQLSFAATLGLIVFTRPLLARMPVWPLGLHTAVAGSLAAQAPLVPLLVAQFHRVAIAAPLLNLAAVPLSAGVLLAGAAAVLASAVSQAVGAAAGGLAWLLAHALLASGEIVHRFPGLDRRVADPPVAAVALYALGLAALAVRPCRRAAALAGAGLVLVAAGRPPAADGLVHVAVLDVGQGDAIVVRSPRGRMWVVDAGPAFAGRDAGEAVVAPYLWRLGTRRLEAVMITHPHPDHGGGMPFLVRAFQPREVLEGIAPFEDPSYEALDDALRASRAGRRSLARGWRASWDGIDVHILAPRGGPPPRRTRNDDSIVLVLRYGEFSMLLAGDVERAGESALAPEAAFALKVPHHGSRSSSTPALVAAVRPAVAIVSAGYRSRFGHPHPEVVARYERAGVQLLRTDRDGSVTLTTDGRRIWVSAHRDGGERRIR